MTDTQADELAALKKKVEELEAKVSPPKSTFVPMTDAEHQNWVHQMRERRMAFATPPSVVRDWNVLDTATCQDLWRHGTVQSPAQSSASGQTRASTPTANPTPGYVDPRPLRPPDGVNYADRLMDERDRRDRAELIEREARFKAMAKLSEQTETMRQQTEALAKLAEPKL